MIVKYSKKFAYAPYLNYDVGFEEEFKVSSDDVEAVMAALRKLDFIAEKFHKENNPHIGEPITHSPVAENNWNIHPPHLSPTPTSLNVIDRKAIERLEILIDDAKVLYDLQILQGQVAKYGLQEAYDKKMDELTKVIGV